MLEHAATAVIAIFITLAIYSGSVRAYRRTGAVWLNPVLVTIVVLIAGLVLLGIDYEAYDRGGRFIRLLLEPSVVALGVPLYLQRDAIKRNARPILVAVAVGSVVGIVVSVGVALSLGATSDVVYSLAPRSVTTPIAIGIAERIGGIPALTAAVVVASGVLGAVVGPAVLRLVGVPGGTSFGLAMGASAHGIGTARAVQEGTLEGASSGIAIGLMGIATALLTPLIIELVHRFGFL